MQVQTVRVLWCLLVVTRHGREGLSPLSPPGPPKPLRLLGGCTARPRVAALASWPSLCCSTFLPATWMRSGDALNFRVLFSCLLAVKLTSLHNLFGCLLTICSFWGVVYGQRGNSEVTCLFSDPVENDESECRRGRHTAGFTGGQT